MKLSVYVMNNRSSFYFSVILYYSQDMLLTKPTRHFILKVTLNNNKKNPKNVHKSRCHIFLCCYSIKMFHNNLHVLEIHFLKSYRSNVSLGLDYTLLTYKTRVPSAPSDNTLHTHDRTWLYIRRSPRNSYAEREAFQTLLLI